MSEILQFNQQINAPVEHLYYAFTRKSGLREWLTDKAEADIKQTKTFLLIWKNGHVVGGKYLELVENKKVVFAWQLNQSFNPYQGEVLFSEEEGMTQVLLTFRDVQAEKIEEFNDFWNKALENLKSVFEAGLDLRQYKKPMMGVLISELVSSEIAEKKQLPINYGLLLSGVIKGMGAEQGGLQSGDILAEVNGVKITDYFDVDQALIDKSAGDSVEMVFYRGAGLLKSQVDLSFRPHLEIPETAQGLADKISKVYSSANARITELLKEVTEDQAAMRAKPGDWHTKEVLAHLIATDRDMLTWASTLVLGNEVYVYSGHLPARIKSILSVSPQLSDLTRMIKQSQDESVAFLSEIPSEFVSRLSSFSRLSLGILEETPTHYKEHLGQIEDNLAFIRQIKE